MRKKVTEKEVARRGEMERVGKGFGVRREEKRERRSSSKRVGRQMEIKLQENGAKQRRG